MFFARLGRERKKRIVFINGLVYYASCLLFLWIHGVLLLSSSIRHFSRALAALVSLLSVVILPGAGLLRQQVVRRSSLLY